MANMKLDKPTRDFVQAEYFWIKPGEACWVEFDVDTTQNKDAEVFAEAIVQSYDEAKKMACVEYENKNLVAKPLVHITRVMQRDPTKHPNLFDLVDLPILNDAELHAKIRDRFSALNIFTYIGPSLLIVNPFKYLKDQYLESLKKEFYDCIQNPKANRVREKPPHVWAIATQAYLDLITFKKNQACCISGESGAGKTVNTKTCMSFITGMNEIFGVKPAEGAQPADDSPIEDKILMCNPILEALGNAKTVRNDNSSRFGKYISLFMENKIVIGASIESYLLEAIRVTTPNKSERNYHIFYQFLKGGSDEEVAKFRLDRNPQNYTFLKKSGCYEVPTVDDLKEYNDHEESMKTLNLTGDWRDAYWRIIALVLHLSNIKYDDSQYTGSNAVKISSQDTLVKICEIMEVEKDILTDALTTRTSIMGGKEMVIFLDGKACQSLSESFAKDIYNKLFSWVIKYLNLALLPPAEKASGGNPAHRYQKIGLLDIFGFEIFDFNSIEQLCINFTNEKLHQLYVEYVFKLEVQTFIEEGLKQYIDNLSFKDNQEVLDLLAHPETKKYSVFNLIDDQSATMSKDAALIDQFRKIHKDSAKMEFDKMKKCIFMIVHTARAVSYTIDGFCEKNKDEVPRPIIKCVLSSKSERFKDIYNQRVKDTDEGVNYLSDVAKKKEQFIGYKFRQQMDALMTELRSCQCSFMRCIKPNEEKSATVWTSNLVVLQIRYLGLLDSIKIRKESYPFRFDFKFFSMKYFEMDNEFASVTPAELEKITPDWKNLSQRILDKYLPQHDHKTRLTGKNKIFLKSEAYQDLEIAFDKCLESKRNAVLLIEIMELEFRARDKLNMARHRFIAAEEVISQLLHGMKTKQSQMNFRNIRKASVKIQACFRMSKQRRIYLNKLACIRDIQAAIESALAQERVAKMKSSALLILEAYRNCKLADRIMLYAMIMKIAKSSAMRAVEVSIEKGVVESVVKIQGRIRGFLNRKTYSEEVILIKKAREMFKYNKAIKVMKKYLIGKVTRRRIQKILLAAAIIQAYFRMLWTKRAFMCMREKTILIQRFIRQWSFRKASKDSAKMEKLKLETIPFMKKTCSDQSRLYSMDEESLRKRLVRESTDDLGGLKIHKPYQQIPEVDSSPLTKIRIHTEVIDADCLDADTLRKYKGSWSKAYIDAHKDAKKSRTEGRVIEVGTSHTVMSTLSGRCYCWGNNDLHQLALKDLEESMSVFRVSKNEEKLRYIAVGDNHTVILAKDRHVFVYGDNATGQLGLGHNQKVDQVEVNVPLSRSKLKNIHAKGDENYAVTEEGDVLFWPVMPDDFSIGILTIPNREQINTISLGVDFSILLSDAGNLFSFGRENRYGQLGLGHREVVLSPTLIEGFSKERVVQVSCGKSHTLCMTRNTKLFAWGEDNYGQLGTGMCTPLALPTQIKLPSAVVKPTQVCCGYQGSYALSEDGSIYWWGKNSRIFLVKKPSLFRVLQSIDLFPIQIRSSWSQSMSVAYLEIADFRYIENINVSVKLQYAKLMANKWNTMDHSQCMLILF